MTDKQQKAQDLFINSGLSQQQIADEVGVNRKTLYDWKQQGNWLRARCIASQAPIVLVEQYYGQLVALNNDIAVREQAYATKEEANIISKINSTIRTVRRDGKTRAETIELFANFSELLREKAPELNDQVACFIDEFINTCTADGAWYKDQQSRNRQEQKYEKEYTEYAEGLFEKSIELLRNDARVVGRRQAAPRPAGTQAENRAAAPQQAAAPAPAFSPIGGANGVPADPAGCAEAAPMAASGQTSLHPNTPKNINSTQGLKLPPPANRRERRQQERLLKELHSRSAGKNAA